MIQLHTFWLVSAALMLAAFGVRADPATAQTTYPFSANYDILATAKDLTPNLQQIFVPGSSTDAPYGLLQTNSLSYSQTNFATGFYSFNTEPTAFGLQGFPSGYITFQESGSSDKLFGAASGTGLIDFATLTVKSSGTVNIIGGEGIFRGATGTLAFSQIQPLSLQVGVALKGRFTVNGSFQTVPEPKTVTPLMGIGVMGVYLLMRRHGQRATSV
ncbi:MAG: hypothetical protein V7K14_02780 [Nostoc sp.]|uniref:hypothetical protein n=1 Tax=Nostoc sp. TaxID=1180 RepID=UPI002FFC1A6A